jgi:predicted nuclease of predicted toxin-antitoxin system
MKLLLDANLSWRLTRLLEPTFPDIMHVVKTGLPVPASDTAIWNWAKANDFIIITNDEDFFNLLLAKGYPPKVIMLRIGNQRTSYLAQVLIQKAPEIEEFALDPYFGVLEIF